jgi:nucleoside-diphosphate kinase
MAETFYEAQKGKPFYPGLVEFMTSGPVVALVLAKADAITGWREVMGPTDVFEARLKAPKWCVRARCGRAGCLPPPLVSCSA